MWSNAEVTLLWMSTVILWFLKSVWKCLSVMCLSAYQKDYCIKTNRLAPSEEIILTPEKEPLSPMQEKMSKHIDRSKKINKCYCYHNRPWLYRIKHKIDCNFLRCQLKTRMGKDKVYRLHEQRRYDVLTINQ